jgi:hypothetical protein
VACPLQTQAALEWRTECVGKRSSYELSQSTDISQTSLRSAADPGKGFHDPVLNAHP